MTRRCSHCSHNRHNSRTCPSRASVGGGGGGVKLFGVRLDGSGPIRKSASMSNLSHHSAAIGFAGASPVAHDDVAGDDREKDGYASEGSVKGASSSCRKKGVAWTEEEHKRFLLGLQKLGKGDWRGISRTYVLTRTPTQVASHAQKYFIRHTNANRRKRRSSLFDMAPDELGHGQQEPEGDFSNITGEHEPTNTNSSNPASEPVEVVTAIPRPETMHHPYPMVCAPYPQFFPFSYPPVWPCFGVEPKGSKAHEVVKPIPVHSMAPIKVDEVVGLSKLSIGEASSSLNLIGGSERHSAFHSSNNQSSSGTSFNPIHAI